VKANLLKWGAAVGALPRILRYQEVLGSIETYFDQLRVVNEALGPHWVFRLADAVGLESIKENRLSWYRFYVEDIDRLHCPLDPGTPETKAYLGQSYSDMDMAFYAGMGFDGYRLALQTPRRVCFDRKHLDFDNRYRFTPSSELKARLDAYDVQRFIPKEDYYSAYSDVLTNLYELIGRVVAGKTDEDAVERVAAGCLILLCGGHHGCGCHINEEERFRAQMESMIIFTHARNVVLGRTLLGDSIPHSTVSTIRAVA